MENILINKNKKKINIFETTERKEFVKIKYNVNKDIIWFNLNK